MGEAMTRRLLDLGFEVTVWNLEPERLETVVPHGAVAAASPAEVAAASDIVMLCVLHMAAVERCIFAEDGVAAGRVRHRRSSSTSRPPIPKARAQAAAKLKALTGAGWVDAPVSGGPQLARTGGMTVMAGGSEADFAQAPGRSSNEMAANVPRWARSARGRPPRSSTRRSSAQAMS